ncbi:glycosyltransferase [Paenibacillus filicis]|uniref:Glycosyltransferase n=1 Tax=Paenibacillus gyeongsangnamensis TaxID=3388067 RepID=A0ABT4Q5Z1_9BACL|nr:glycosyltransferase [Paenibacillus filicis]MCZ8512233.1 glycosyltransferase [Paenibacillus filicis]
MRRNSRILILTSSYGDGHLQAARSLKQAFHMQGTDEVLIMDLMKEAHPVLNKISTTIYITSMLTSQFGFDYYGWSYYMTRNTKTHLGLGRFFNNLGKKKLKEAVERVRPDAIISTFPYGAVPELCAQIGIPAYTVVTDFTLHSRWVHPNINKYYVATEDLKEELMSIGFAGPQIEVSGIPIRQAFDHAAPANTNKFRGVLSPERRTILILAGSYGVLGNVDEMIDSLQNVPDTQLVVVCGRNEKLERKLRSKFGGRPHCHIFGFVEDIHELMAASSCIVTKAGGLTLSEALSLKVPIFIYKPFAGQEKENANFLARKGAALISHQMEELSGQIRQLLADGAGYGELMQRMSQLQRKSAAEYIIQDMLGSMRQTAPLTGLQH